MADQFTLPGIDATPKFAWEESGQTSGDSSTFAWEQPDQATQASEVEFSLPGIDRPFGLPTVKSAEDIPSDLLTRMKIHAKEGAEAAITGVEALVPGSPSTIWRGKQPDESTLAFLASKLKPLGIAYGPAEILLSPVTAGISEAARLGSEVERGVRNLRPDQKPILQHVEEWAPVLSQLGGGFVGPARRGLLKFALGPGGRESAAQIAARAAERWSGLAERGIIPTETALKGLAKNFPAAEELGAALRTSEAEAMRFQSMLTKHGGLEEALIKLTPEQQAEFWQRATGEIPAFTSPEMQAFEKVYQGVFGAKEGLRPQLAEAVGLRGKSLEGKTVPFTPQPGFYGPRVYETETSKKIREVLEHERFLEGKPITTRRNIVWGEERPFLTRAAYARNPEANALAQEYIKDVPTAVLKSIEEFSRTLGRAAAFGPEGEKLNTLVSRLASEVGGTKGVVIGKQLFDSISRDLGPGAAKSVGLDSLRVFQAITKMPLSFISNATQSTITAITAGARNTVHAIYDTGMELARTGELPKIVNELGLISKTARRTLEQEISGAAPRFLAKAGQVILRPFEAVERFNQVVAARAGELATEKLSAKLARTGGLSTSEWRWLKNSDLNVDAIQARVAAQGGGLLPHEVRRAAFGLLDRTQYLARPTAMPYIMRNAPLTRLIFQMKTFAVRATEGIWREVGSEAMQGNFKPLARLMTYYPIAGEATREINEVIRGKEGKTWEEIAALPAMDKVKRALVNATYVGGFGIASDALVALNRGWESTSSYALGPGITDILQEAGRWTNIVQHAANLPAERQKLETARRTEFRATAQRVPFVGSQLRKFFMTPQELQKERMRQRQAA